MANSFFEDVYRGKEGETAVAATLIKRGMKVIDMTDNAEYRRKDIDFIVFNRKDEATTLEVKSDYKSDFTGNVFIEQVNYNNQYEDCRGWYYYTEAEYIGFYQPVAQVCHIVKYDDIREHLRIHCYKTGCSNNTKGTLFPIAALTELPSYYCLTID